MLIEKVITNLKRVSKPGLRVYKKREDLPKVLNGLAIKIGMEKKTYQDGECHSKHTH